MILKNYTVMRAFAHGCFFIHNFPYTILDESGDLKMKLFGTMRVNEQEHLEIGGCDANSLAKEFGTPVYVVDEELVRNNCREFKDNFFSTEIETEVIYASKAFLTLSMCKIVEEEGLSLDVVSGGELYTALKAGFPVEKIYMHGNNKTKDELAMAIKAGIGRIVVDNKTELELLEHLCKSMNINIEVLLRVNPGIEAHTHEYIKTTKNDSKFGVSIFSEDIYKIINKFQKSKWLTLKGFHCHIGSQIFQEESFYEGVLAMIDFLGQVKENSNFVADELNLGGGFGIYYFEGDRPIELKNFLNRLISITIEKTKEVGLKTPKIMIEPGRSIIANAGTTLYEVGGTKNTYGGKNYVFVDGSMNDNPRTALYGAKYEAVIANRMNAATEDIFTIAGKCCESGDMIVKDIELALPKIGDIVAVLSTGAYNYSMSSNYNKMLRPPVVFVKDGQAKLVVRRETYEDLIRTDMLA